MQVCERPCAIPVTYYTYLNVLLLTDIYYLGFPRDRPLPKILVTVAYLTECLQISLSTRDAFHDFGSGWGNTSELDDVGWQWFNVVILMVVRASTHIIHPFLNPGSPLISYHSCTNVTIILCVENMELQRQEVGAHFDCYGKRYK